ncbi:stage II sporulation protein D [Paludifilum halophilum]|uniref:Stage II sporulation protein D n=2 Tax=Paludifilum halophilum TaxID=1642702 RepID=A0A235B7C8_9BACL|nr:stage II sporulation protein D [Paludifilum halophilum]
MILLVALLISVMIAVPAVLVSLDSSSGSEDRRITEDPGGGTGPDVKVYLTEEKRVVELPLEEYIRGVVAAEMPADFHLEALKAQALAARTYIVDRLNRGDFSDMKESGADGAQVTDTVQHQVFKTDEQLRQNWGDQYDEFSRRIDEAVRATRGKVIQYDGEPIYAAFFSTSNGRTENSEDYFAESYPYLRSVPSPWDEKSPKYKDQKKMSVKEFLGKLEEESGNELALPASGGSKWIQVEKKTEGGRIGEIRVGDQTFTGRQIREALDLSSTDFSWNIQGDSITLTTRGYGHGVGMSQWGANLMAMEGKKAKEIVQYYYQGVKIGNASSILAKKEE